MLKLKLHYFGHLMRRVDSRQKEKGMTEDEVVNSITNSMDMNLSKL